MLSPDYLLRISEGAEEIAEELHTDILNRIIERIMIRIGRGDNYLLTAQDKWQLQVLTDAGYLLEDIQTEIAQRVGLMQTEIAEAMEDAGVKAVEYDNAVYQAAGLSPKSLDQSPSLIRIMQRNYEATLGEWTNFTGTIAGAAQQSFIRACDRAYQLAMSGTLSYSQAVKEALDALVADGVTVTYPSGHTDTIETATLRAVRTGISQASGQITDARMEEMDWDIILVSSHMGARPGDGAEDFKNHAWWQGKFYSKSGKDKRFPPWSVCGMGHVQGIHGANCRHSHGPGDGENNPYEHYDTEENRKAYELQQRQRTLERRIRDTKRQTMNWKTARDNATDEAVKADLDFQYQRKAALLQKQNKAYNDFCEETGLKKRSERISIAKWDRKQAAAARGAAKRYDGRMKTAQLKQNSSEDVPQIFKLNNQYRATDGTFDLQAAKKDCSDFLTSVPEKHRILLEQSFTSVEYEQAKLEDAPFGYSHKRDKVLFDPTQSDFWSMDFTTANTHELAHRIDMFFAQSADSIDFSNAITNAKKIIEDNPLIFMEYSKNNDEQGYISDIFSAITDDKYPFMAGHDAEYWAEAGNKEREIFANLFSLEAFQDTGKIEFLRTNFTELFKAFDNIDY
jgi:hypothetical protein